MPLEAPTNQTLRPRQSVMGVFRGLKKAMALKHAW
jgi:hypothetical protein